MIVRRSSICLTIACCAGALVIAGRLDADDDAKPELPASHSVAPQLHATGFEFAEGPAVNPKSGDLFVVNYRGNGRIGRIATDGTAQVWCDLRVAAPLDGRSPQANGLKIDNEQRIVAADAGGGRLLRISRDGKQVEVLADRWKGKRFDAVNDVALDAAGNIYFSDPGESTYDNPIGSVYRYSIRTKQVTRIDDELAYPNGLAVTPDQKHLCVAESHKFRILIYDLAPDGAVANRRVLTEFPAESQGQIRGGKFYPDGMIFDNSGRLYVAMWTGGFINVVDTPSGKLVRQYDAGGSKATNCHFSGKSLLVTVAAKEAVFRLDLGVEGFQYQKAP